MECIELKLQPTFENVTFGTVATLNIAKAYYEFFIGKEGSGMERFIHAVELAVGEACTNSVKHGGDGQNPLKSVRIKFEMDEKSLVIMVCDTNERFDFDSVPRPDARDMPENGLGIHIMKESMDRVSHVHRRGWNIITLEKAIPAEEVP